VYAERSICFARQYKERRTEKIMPYGILELLSDLKYDQSSYYRTNVNQFEPETAHLFRAAREIPDDSLKVHGVYVFRSNPDSKNKILPDRPAIYISQADDEKSARIIHKSLWNLAYAPYILVLLPDSLKVYTGFDFSSVPGVFDTGLLDVQPLRRSALRDILNEFSADSVDIGHIWRSSKYRSKIDPSRRVDKKLLRNLQQLGEALKGVGQLSPDVAHALIGKYVYIKYLWDRGVLTEEWLNQKGVSKESVLGRSADVKGLASLIEALDERFNGGVFPFDPYGNSGLNDDHVNLTASVFMGDTLHSYPTHIIRQLHLEFQAYDFRYIPVETLSAVYEQFIENPKEKGAIYTPEAVADYVLSEVNSFKPLTPETKVLDPACGSGIFLVLTYRRLIEQELAKRSAERLPPSDVKALLANIYGVERELDACFVAEFSLILTLLHYIEPRELHKNEDFKFPYLHNTQIFHGDFFNKNISLWKGGKQFDWIVGNPPWVRAGEKQLYAHDWIIENQDETPVGNLSLAEAFSWRVTDITAPGGIDGLLMPATSLVNILSKEYRQAFFEKNKVFRITNFANWRDVLFPGRSALPPASLVYRKRGPQEEVSNVIHYGPFYINQTQSVQGEPWAITINKNEIQTIPYSEAIEGKTATWKFALWGNDYDERTIERIRHIFPTTLEECCYEMGWGEHLPKQGAELRDCDAKTEEELKYLEQLVGARRFDTEQFNLPPRLRYSIPKEALVKNKKFCVRVRGGEGSLRVNAGPHIILSKGWDFIIYSDKDFIIPPQQMGIAAPRRFSDHLRALSVYLSSSLVKYYLFFHVPEWGFYRHRESVVVSEVRKIPTPNFTAAQVRRLADLQRRLVAKEKSAIGLFTDSLEIMHQRLQSEIDRIIYKLFKIPGDIASLINDFVQVRLPLDGGKASAQSVTKEPSKEELEAYAATLCDELNEFAMNEFYHTIKITKSPELVECIIEVTRKKPRDPAKAYTIMEADLSIKELLSEIRENLGEQFSQWAYIQKGLKLFEGPRIYIYKYPRLINWTKSQALNDAGEVIGDAISSQVARIA
jgi:hypothetical protein